MFVLSKPNLVQNHLLQLLDKLLQMTEIEGFFPINIKVILKCQKNSRVRGILVDNRSNPLSIRQEYPQYMNLINAS